MLLEMSIKISLREDSNSSECYIYHPPLPLPLQWKMHESQTAINWFDIAAGLCNEQLLI